MHRIEYFFIVARAERVDIQRHRSSLADCVTDLQQRFIRKPRRNDVFANVPSIVRSRPIHLGRVLARKRAAAVRDCAAVSIYYYLAPRNARVASGTADDKPARRVDKYIRAAQKFIGNNALDDAVDNAVAYLFFGRVWRVLRGHDNRLNADRHAVLVSERHHGFAVGTQKIKFPALAHFGKPFGKRVRQRYRHGHKLVRFRTGIPEHHTLIARARAVVLARRFAAARFERTQHPARNIGRLPVNAVEHGAGARVEAQRGVGIAHLGNGRARYLLYVDKIGLSIELAEHDGKPRRTANLASDSAVFVLFERGVENSVRNVIANFIGMSFGNAFRRYNSVHLFLRMRRKITRQSFTDYNTRFGDFCQAQARACQVNCKMCNHGAR